MSMSTANDPHAGSSSDNQDRVRDFLARHGGASQSASREGTTMAGSEGWKEVYASDGYTLRCDWSRLGTTEEMKFAEIAPVGS